MFKWLKKRIAGKGQPDPVAQDEWNSTDTLKLVTAWDVVDRFLVNNPAPTPYSVHALIDAGAADLMDHAELLQACEKIQEHGYQYPLNGALVAKLDESELMDFLRWQSRTDIAKGCYDNEVKIGELVEHFRSCSGGIR